VLKKGNFIKIVKNRHNPYLILKSRYQFLFKKKDVQKITLIPKKEDFIEAVKRMGC
jgi:hypothetical protein